MVWLLNDGEQKSKRKKKKQKKGVLLFDIEVRLNGEESERVSLETQ